MQDGPATAPISGDAPGTARAFPIVVVGHVDHGKSTLIGRLLHDTGALPEERIAQLRDSAARRGLDLEYSFLLDSLQVERDQGITVDAAQIWFSSARRRYAIIDAPGHVEFLRNMVTGAAAAEAAVLVVDARAGICEQTRRHGYLLSLLGLRQLAVAVNKIDLVDYDAAHFAALEAALRHWLGELGLAPAAILPLSARHGDNLLARGPNLSWYEGPTLLGALDGFRPREPAEDAPLRLPVQDVYRQGEQRIAVGRIESGRLAVGDRLCFAPGGQQARIAGIEMWNGRRERRSAGAGESVALRFEEAVFIERGVIAAHAGQAPRESHVANVQLFWLDREPLREGDRLLLRHGTTAQRVTVEAIEAVIDVETLTASPASFLPQNGVARARLRARRAMAIDSYGENPRTGRGVLVRGHRLVGGCIVEALPEQALDLTAIDAPVTRAERALANGHRGGVLWLTGLPGAGKSTLAMRLLRALTDAGRQAYVLDGDNLRQGLNRDLGFREEDRRENTRRTAELARLLADAGLIVIVALISPLAAHRALARQLVGEGFHEIYVKADLATCEARDPKGLYRKARQDQLADFTGVSAPYEPPAEPGLVVDTAAGSVEACLALLLRHSQAAFALSQRDAA
ncbi:adenylyl-sulfate kinase [Pseudoroseomonas cervicalis]|uniref:adenylyl-sulfate kinase n=1 Tax=Teichococcus cervicalis TaxID=204525 RepID=UPI00277D1D8E|nr:adenylyl-sulfate kinase [Pseudoroseomonas cervicalis]MDQ1078873.1 bifunctional enzyme CysN/CysC [Pseudoroseomonas cervicalis]